MIIHFLINNLVQYITSSPATSGKKMSQPITYYLVPILLTGLSILIHPIDEEKFCFA